MRCKEDGARQITPAATTDYAREGRSFSAWQLDFLEELDAGALATPGKRQVLAAMVSLHCIRAMADCHDATTLFD